MNQSSSPEDKDEVLSQGFVSSDNINIHQPISRDIQRGQQRIRPYEEESKGAADQAINTIDQQMSQFHVPQSFSSQTKNQPTVKPSFKTLSDMANRSALHSPEHEKVKYKSRRSSNEIHVPESRVYKPIFTQNGNIGQRLAEQPKDQEKKLKKTIGQQIMSQTKIVHGKNFVIKRALIDNLGPAPARGGKLGDIKTNVRDRSLSEIVKRGKLDVLEKKPGRSQLSLVTGIDLQQYDRNINSFQTAPNPKRDSSHIAKPRDEVKPAGPFTTKDQRRDHASSNHQVEYKNIEERLIGLFNQGNFHQLRVTYKQYISQLNLNRNVNLLFGALWLLQFGLRIWSVIFDLKHAYISNWMEAMQLSVFVIFIARELSEFSRKRAFIERFDKMLKNQAKISDEQKLKMIPPNSGSLNQFMIIFLANSINFDQIQDNNQKDHFKILQNGAFSQILIMCYTCLAKNYGPHRNKIAILMSTNFNLIHHTATNWQTVRVEALCENILTTIALMYFQYIIMIQTESFWEILSLSGTQARQKRLISYKSQQLPPAYEFTSSETQLARVHDKLAIDKQEIRVEQGPILKTESQESSRDTHVVKRAIQPEKREILSSSSLAHYNFWSSLNSRGQSDSQLELGKSINNQVKSEVCLSAKIFQNQMLKEGQAFLCNVRRTNVRKQSDIIQKNLMYNQSLKNASPGKQQNLNRVNVDILQASENFFEHLPFFGRISHFIKMNQSAFSTMKKKSSQDVQLSSKLGLQRSLSLGAYHKNTTQDQRLDLSFVEQEMLELNMFQPYFINNATIIQYSSMRNIKNQRLQLSIQDILEDFKKQKAHRLQLYFVTDLTTAVESKYAHMMGFSSLEQPKSSLKKSNSMTGFQSQAEKAAKIAQDLHSIKELGSMESPNFSRQQKGQKNQRNMLKAKRKDSNSHEKSSLNQTPKSSQDIEFDPPTPKRHRTGNFNHQNFSLALNDTSNKFESEFSEESSNLLDSNGDPIDSDCSSLMMSLNYEQNPTLNSKQDDFGHKYYEIEISQVLNSPSSVDEQQDELVKKDYILFKIRDITKIVKHQQKFSDQIYQDAIENNYSHEQMTPMGPIIAFSNIIKKKLVELFAYKIKIPIEKPLGNLQYLNTVLKKLVSNSQEAQASLQQIISIEQSAKSVMYYSQNQIARMKISKNELVVHQRPCTEIETQISNVIWPFEFQIYNRRINVYIFKQQKIEFTMYADWVLYEYVLFNIVQNAVKFNKPMDGEILIILSLKPKKPNFNERKPRTQLNEYDSSLSSKLQTKDFVLETQVIDSGEGIPLDIQKTLFIPFLELKNSQGLSRDRCGNIGLGLSCSRQIVKAMGGDIILKESQRGLTNIAFKIPVKKRVDKISNGSLFRSVSPQNSSSNSGVPKNRSKDGSSFNLCENIDMIPEEQKSRSRVQIIGQTRQIPQQIRDYLALNNIMNLDSELSIRDGSGQQSSNSQVQYSDIFVSNIQKISFQHLNRMGSQNVAESHQDSLKSKDFLSNNRASVASQKSPTNSNQGGQNSQLLIQSRQQFHPNNSAGLRRNFTQYQAQAQSVDFTSPEQPQVNRKQTPDFRFQPNFKVSSKNNLLKRSDQFEPSSLVDPIEEHEQANRMRMQAELQDIPQIPQMDEAPNPADNNFMIVSQSIEEESKHSGGRNIAFDYDYDSEVIRPRNQRQRHNQSYQIVAQQEERRLKNLEDIIIDNQNNSHSSNSLDEASIINRRPSIIDQLEQMSIEDISDLPALDRKKIINKILTENHKSPIHKIIKNKFNVQQNNNNNQQNQAIEVPVIINNNQQNEAIEVPVIINNRSCPEQNIQHQRNNNRPQNNTIYDILLREEEVQRHKRECKSQKLCHLNIDNNQSSSSSCGSLYVSYPGTSIDNLQSYSHDIAVRRHERSGQMPPPPRQQEERKRDNREPLEEEKDLQVEVQNESSFFIESQVDFSPSQNNESLQFRRESPPNLLDNRQLQPFIEEQKEQADFRQPRMNKSIQPMINYDKLYRHSSKQVHSDQQQRMNFSKITFSSMQQRKQKSDQDQIFNINNQVDEENSVSNSSLDNHSPINQRQGPSDMEKIEGQVSDLSGNNCNCDAKILLVDDTDFLIQTHIMMIRQKYQMVHIDTAMNGQIAVEMFKEALRKDCGCINRAYKLVLMDIQMPEMDGYQATSKIIEALNQEQNRPNRSDNIDYLSYHSIIALTSYTGRDVQKRCRALGMKDLLNKPATAESLHAIVEKYFYNNSDQQDN